MSLFDLTFSSSELLEGYLKRLGMKPAHPSLIFLNQLIKAHQESIPFENFTRICDFKEKTATFPTLEESLRHIINGYGGVCWSLARSFRWLLAELGFVTEYLYMESGHVCIRVRLDQDYYVDVGYGAPFFEAKPLGKSFVVTALAEEFAFTVGEREATVVRTPGPSKKLILTPFTHSQIEAEFNKGNIWKQNTFLSKTLILKYHQERLVRLNGNSFLDYRSGSKVERVLDDEEIIHILRDVFQVSPDMYLRARAYLA